MPAGQRLAKEVSERRVGIPRMIAAVERQDLSHLLGCCAACRLASELRQSELQSRRSDLKLVRAVRQMFNS
jgi:hypothetical protein